ncbi:hypothetical protein HQ447_08255, partial [bacterium]|nr:hypothetical protein [bacterium]
MNRLIRFSLLMMVSSVAHGQATLADYRLEPAGPHGVTLGYGQSSSVALTLTNPSASTADWRLAFANAGPSGLAGVLAGLDKNAAGVLAILPDRFLFSEGITGSSISDGGGDMYDGGNMLAAGATTLNYSNGVLANATAGSGSVSYFTRKLDGLFVMAADFNAVDSFAISGNLGADGSGLVSADEFTIASDGVTYRALVHRVYSAGDPSINQLILVPQKTGISRSFLPTTSNEDHRVSGLGASSRVYYLLFAKAGGGFYPTNVFQDLAAAFLGSFRSGPGWAFGDPSLGQVAAGKSGLVKITLSAAGLEPGTHSARFAVVPQSLADAAIPTATFRDLILQINPPTFTVAGGSPTVSTLAGLSPPPVTVPLTPAAAGSLLSGLQTSSSQPWLVPTPVPGSNAVQLTFNSSALAVGSYRATVDVWNGETRQSFEVSLVVSQLNVVKLLPDPARPRIYAINKNGKERGSILVIDTLTHAILKTISVGREPTDIDLTENAAELLVMNTTDRSISRINLSTLAVTATHQLTAFENQNEDFGGHVIDGP